MNAQECREAIDTAIRNHIPFDSESHLPWEELEVIVAAVADQLGYERRLPHCFRHGTRSFYLDPAKGLRWGTVRNDRKIGWHESREATPLPERSAVIKDSAPVFGRREDLIDSKNSA